MSLKRWCIIFVASVVCHLGWCQTNSTIRNLENQRKMLQEQIASSQAMLSSTNKNVTTQLNNLSVMSGRIEEQKKLIAEVNKDIETLSIEIMVLERQLNALNKELQKKKEKYDASVLYMYKNRNIQNKLLFVFSAKSIEQSYRRWRYVQKYADYQRMQGEDLMNQQNKVTKKKKELLNVQKEKQKWASQKMDEEKKLVAMEQEQKKLVDSLKQKQKALKVELAQKKKQNDNLNRQIERLIAEEIERARKRAEEEEKRRLALEAKTRNKSNSGAVERTIPKKNNESYTVSEENRALSNSFVQNKGRLPMPITGPFLIVSRYGQYAVSGLKNVVLDNKGIDIQGYKDAQARAIFDGKVAAVFKLNGLFNVLIRHGQYISVYCNLSNAVVKAGDKVKTKQILGKVFTDNSEGNRTVLHFQLRKEKEKLNPEQWVR